MGVFIVSLSLSRKGCLSANLLRPHFNENFSQATLRRVEDNISLLSISTGVRIKPRWSGGEGEDDTAPAINSLWAYNAEQSSRLGTTQKREACQEYLILFATILYYTFNSFAATWWFIGVHYIIPYSLTTGLSTCGKSYWATYYCYWICSLFSSAKFL